MKKIILSSIIFSFIILTSCNKLIDVGTPNNQLTTDKVFSDTSSATAAMVSIYARFNATADPNFNKFMSTYTDELMYSGPTQQAIEYYQSRLSVNNSTNQNFWASMYFVIYQCNDMITQLKNSTALPSAMVTTFTDEAKFLRAYAYFNLINVYGHIPLVVGTNVSDNANAVQTDSGSVYNQIVADLTEAQNGLSETYVGSGKVRANKWAVTALLAKVYLYKKNWSSAEAQATLVINSGLYTPLPTPFNAFTANSQETILSFWTQNGFIADGPNLIPSSGTPQYPVTSSLLNSFEANDLRKSTWLRTTIVNNVTYYYPYKYHNRVANTGSPEYLVALRSAEQYLIRAEARAQLNNVDGAIDDINVVRARAAVPLIVKPITQSACIDTIIHERRVEMFVENANRFMDLKRTGSLNAILTPLKSTWRSSGVFLPIPQKEITYDSGLIQNDGY